MPIDVTPGAPVRPIWGAADGVLPDGRPFWTLDESIYGLHPHLSGQLRRAGFTYAGIDRPAGHLLFVNPIPEDEHDAHEVEGAAPVPARAGASSGGEVRAGDAEGSKAPRTRRRSSKNAIVKERED